jgi:hypothetical protein
VTLKTYTYAATKHGPRIRISGEIVSTQTVVTELCTLRAALKTAKILIESPRLNNESAMNRINEALE